MKGIFGRFQVVSDGFKVDQDFINGQGGWRNFVEPFQACEQLSRATLICLGIGAFYDSVEAVDQPLLVAAFEQFRSGESMYQGVQAQYRLVCFFDQRDLMQGAESLL